MFESNPIENGFLPFYLREKQPESQYYQSNLGSNGGGGGFGGIYQSQKYLPPMKQDKFQLPNHEKKNHYPAFLQSGF